MMSFKDDPLFYFYELLIVDFQKRLTIMKYRGRSCHGFFHTGKHIVLVENVNVKKNVLMHVTSLMYDPILKFQTWALSSASSSFPDPSCCFRKCFLCFIRRFWNQVFTYESKMIED